MRDEELGTGEERGRRDGLNSCSSSKVGEAEKEDNKASGSSPNEGKDVDVDERASSQVINIVISQPEEVPLPKESQSKRDCDEKDDKATAAVTVPAASKKFLQRSESYHEVCRVCQQQTEEALVVLGCRCRGELANVHRSCIDIWFRSRGSNKCEICQQVAANIPTPDSLPSSNYWVWRADPASGSGIGRGRHGCCSPLWVAFSILIGGLLLDVLISVSLGVSALPVNIIIGVLIVLGLGTAFRLALECCHEWSLRRNFQMAETTVNPGYPPTV